MLECSNAQSIISIFLNLVSLNNKHVTLQTIRKDKNHQTNPGLKKLTFINSNFLKWDKRHYQNFF